MKIKSYHFLTVSLLFALLRSAAATSYTFTNIADTTGVFSNFSQFGEPIAADGTVAFFASLDGGGKGIFTGSGGTLTTIADSTTEPLEDVSDNFAISAEGTVAFRLQPVNGSLTIFTGNGGPRTTIAVAGRHALQLLQRPNLY